MSVYRCNICENLYDADYQGCFEDPNDPTGCLCEECSDNTLDEIELFVERLHDPYISDEKLKEMYLG